MKIAIIPARFGSKRIKKKNIKLFYSKPMIVWTLKKLTESNFFDKIVVTSDSKKILNISKNNGADILIHRPKKLSGDIVGTLPVISHALKQLKKYNYNESYVCCVYPCNPFLNLKDVKNGFLRMKKNLTKFIFPVTEYSHPIQRALKLNANNHAIPFLKKNSNKRTQDLEKTYFDAGQFYWATSNLWHENNSIHKSGMCIPIPSWRVVDIDNLSDWKRAEVLFKNFFIKA
jgi:pseudaminic acid cytidylyltransferase